MLKSQSGMITLDFLFAFVLVMGFAGLLFALTLTLTVVEITQYVTFASARNYSASHINVIYQEQQARLKYKELTETTVFAPLYSNGWFEIDKPEAALVGDATTVFPEYKQSSPEEPNLFYGVGTKFIARMLEFNIPFFGSTTDDGDGQGSGFKTFIASYLSREVTTNECLNFFNARRWEKIRSLPVSNASPYSVLTPANEAYVIVSDNGC